MVYTSKLKKKVIRISHHIKVIMRVCICLIIFYLSYVQINNLIMSYKNNLFVNPIFLIFLSFNILISIYFDKIYNYTIEKKYKNILYTCWIILLLYIGMVDIHQPIPIFYLYSLTAFLPLVVIGLNSIIYPLIKKFINSFNS
jgi:hypothetical protein